MPTDRRRWFAGLAAFAVFGGFFAVRFDEGQANLAVDVSWLLACLAWTAAWWRSDTPSAERLGHPWWLYLTYAACLLPFATNWRWVMTGDTLSYVGMGLSVAENGLNRSLLSGQGPDQYTALQMHFDHLFMYLFEPTAFWSRVGKITMAVMTMAAIFTVFARLVSRPFGILVAACSATCSVWIVYTFSHFPFLNGIAAAYAVLAFGLWVRRDPLSVRAWLSLGLLCGIMLYASPSGWPMAVFVWVWLGVLALWLRWPLTLPILSVVTTVIVAYPMLVQWAIGSGRGVFTLVENPSWTFEKVWRFVVEAATFPFSSQVRDSGAFGPQLPEGFRWLFPVGVVITPLFRKYFPAARFVLVLLIANVLVLALAQGPYASVSVKRALVLIPMASYFAFLPFWRWLTRLPVVLVIIAVWASLGVYDVAYRIRPGTSGYTLLDGAVEAYQRFGNMCLYLAADEARAEHLKPGGFLDKLYRFSDTLHVVHDPTAPECRDVLCYCSQEQCAHADLAALGYTPVRMLNSVEIRCGLRDAQLANELSARYPEGRL